MSHTVFTCRSEACCSAVSTLSYCTWPVTIGGSRDQSGLWPFLHICLSGWPLPPLHNQMTLLPDTIRVSDHILHSRRTILPYPIRVFFPFCTILALGTLLPDPNQGFPSHFAQSEDTIAISYQGFLPILHNPGDTVARSYQGFPSHFAQSEDTVAKYFQLFPHFKQSEDTVARSYQGLPSHFAQSEYTVVRSCQGFPSKFEQSDNTDARSYQGFPSHFAQSEDTVAK